MRYRLSYSLRDNGDGSASVVLAKTWKDAEKTGNEAEGFGENCADYVIVVIKDGVPHYEDSGYNEKTKKWTKKLIPLEKVQDA